MYFHTVTKCYLCTHAISYYILGRRDCTEDVKTLMSQVVVIFPPESPHIPYKMTTQYLSSHFSNTSSTNYKGNKTALVLLTSKETKILSLEMLFIELG